MSSESHYLKILSRPDIAPDVMEALLTDRGARKYHTVRCALAGHPRTPRNEALSLVGTLYWRDLARLSADSRIHPEVRRAADRDLVRRLSEMALSERVDLARSAGRGTLLVLRFDSDVRVLQAVLDNRFATEPDLVQVAARVETPPAALEAIAAHPRWGIRPLLRSALLRNPRLPTAVALSLLSRASASDLAGLKETPGVSRLIKACAERVLARRKKPH
jgi:hypothetical protein